MDFDVVIGDNVKIQNGAQLYHGVTLEDGVFVGPLACLTNDRFPRAITPDGHLKAADDWEVGPILVRRGASIGAGAIVLPGVTIGRFALVAAGAVVTDLCTRSRPRNRRACAVGRLRVRMWPAVEQAEGIGHCSHCGESL